MVQTTLANLSTCPPEAVDALRLALRGVERIPKEGFFAVEKPIPTAMYRLSPACRANGAWIRRWLRVRAANAIW
jgi:hypothetical protein